MSLVDLCVKSTASAQKCKYNRSLAMFLQLILFSPSMSSGTAADLNATERFRICVTCHLNIWSSPNQGIKVWNLRQKNWNFLQTVEIEQDLLNLICFTKLLVSLSLETDEPFATNASKVHY